MEEDSRCGMKEGATWWLLGSPVCINEAECQSGHSFPWGGSEGCQIVKGTGGGHPKQKLKST